VGSAWVPERQKAQAMTRSLEFSASPLHSPEKGERIKTELIIGHTCVSTIGVWRDSRLVNTSMWCTGRVMRPNPTGMNKAFCWPKGDPSQ